MPSAKENNPNNEYLVPWYVTGIVAFVCAIALVTIAVMGPAFLGIIKHRTSQSGIIQTIAFDVTDLIVLTPLLLIGGALQLAKKENSKYFLVLTPITLMFVGLEYGLAQEWSIAAYTGNVEAYSWLFLTLITGGLILLLGTLPRFKGEETPDFRKNWLRIYVGVMILFLLMFAFMWASQVYEVALTGNNSAGDYLAAPNGFWVVRYFDLGITIPIGLMALSLLLSQPKKAYPLLLLFFGFFIALATSVNASAILLVQNNDPSVSGSGAGGLVIFPVLGFLAYAGLFYLVRNKLRGAR